ncbi:MAG: sulfate adenylyltransferase, partial [Hyphomicrobiaceae bacterium]|nr:sulfate adenylyltransferase [Hyphomicrobiaceae bacterium]
PGHEQYTRNMASGASHADVAIMLVDARSGVKRQTRRHAAILDLMGVKRVVLAVNKMDLVDWDEATFRRITADFAALTAGYGFIDAVAIPVSAVGGDNIAARSTEAPWFNGPVLLDYLEAAPSRASNTAGPFRMAVQTVLRDGQDFRGLAGTVNSGRVCVGDRIVDVLSGQSSRVLRIATMDRDLEIASTGQAVAIQLEHDLDIARGAILSGSGKPPVAAREIEARLVWLSETPFDPAANYLLRTTTDLVTVSGIALEGLLDLETMASTPATACGLNDIALARLTLSRTAAADRFADIPATGTVMLVDALTGASLAGGVILAAADVPAAISLGQPATQVSAQTTFVLTRARLAGLNADLTNTKADRAEAARRAAEIVKLLAAAGVIAVVEG